MRRKNCCLVWTGVFLFGFAVHLLSAQIASSTRDGVYTVEQAQHGKVLYGKQCSMCHRPDLEGMGQNLPLVGDDFLNNWDDQTLADLYTKTHTSMPASKPGSLTPTETVQLLAYILSVNKFSAGKTDLPIDLSKLKAIHIDKLATKP